MLPMSFNYCSILLYSGFSVLFCRLFRQTSFLLILCLYKVLYNFFLFFFQFNREIIFFFIKFSFFWTKEDWNKICIRSMSCWKVSWLLCIYYGVVLIGWSPGKLHTFDDRQVEDAQATLAWLLHCLGTEWECKGLSLIGKLKLVLNLESLQSQLSWQLLWVLLL